MDAIYGISNGVATTSGTIWAYGFIAGISEGDYEVPTPGYTVREMLIEFERNLHNLDSRYKSSDKVDTDTMLYFINAAQELYVKTKFKEAKLNEQLTFENKLRNLEDLATLISYHDGSFISVHTGRYNGKAGYTAPPSDYMFYIHSMTTVSRTNEDNIRYAGILVENVLAEHDSLSRFLTTGHNKPFFDKPIIIIGDSDNNVNIFIDYYTDVMTSIDLTYLKAPAILTIAGGVCELPEHTHRDIIDIAINLFLQSIKQSKE